jgi:hypothetical protein
MSYARQFRTCSGDMREPGFVIYALYPLIGFCELV